MNVEGLHVRPALPEDPAAPLLYVSAQPYYDAYAGSGRRARRILERLFPHAGHAASWDVCTVAEDAGGDLLGVLTAFPAREGDRLARRFVSLSAVYVPLQRWPRVVRHLRASARVSPHPPADSLYIDALAVVDLARRRGVARALLAEAERQAGRQGLGSLSLDTGIGNDPARALYRAAGFEQTDERRAPDARTQRAIGGPGFVSYVKAL